MQYYEQYYACDVEPVVYLVLQVDWAVVQIEVMRLAVLACII